MIKDLKKKIDTKKANIGIIGLGYVGLPLALEFAKKGFVVLGIDINNERVNAINKGKSQITDIPDNEIRRAITQKKFIATTNYSAISKLDALIICVPTPLRKTKEPDLSYIIDAAKKLAKYLKKGTLISLESTTYPGTTEERVLPIFEKRGLKLDKDFYLVFSPERIDPGNVKYTTSNITKVIGGVSSDSASLAKALYEKIISKVIVVSSSRAAEMVKLLENSFRSVNIALANELAVICHKMGIDVWEIVDAAATKPFGYIAFYPGPGLGGHCIPIDPLYLTWKARMEGLKPRFIELASQVNSYMPQYVVERLTEILRKHRKELKCSKILVLGVAYKKNVNDTRESPAIEIIELLKRKGALVSYHDPYVPALRVNRADFKSMPLSESILKQQDCVAIITDHANVNYARVIKNAELIFDTRNAIKQKNKKVIKL
ncbi:MAG: nucleotide sugar dehydrogenase [Candidatus Omnitrophota bacterium]